MAGGSDCSNRWNRVCQGHYFRAFAASDLDVNRAATALFVHANTVRYRLGGIAETTGYDPRTFSGLLELVCLIDTIEDDQGQIAVRPPSTAKTAPVT
jgi:hypothetical protein